MKKEITMYDGDMIATYDDTQELRDKVFNKIMSWFEKNSFSTGEGMQNDNFSIEAPEVMDDKGQVRYGEPCYYPFDIIDGKIINLDKMEHDGSWLIQENMQAVPFGKVTMWRYSPDKN